jgi:hypothetical protein
MVAEKKILLFLTRDSLMIEGYSSRSNTVFTFNREVEVNARHRRRVVASGRHYKAQVFEFEITTIILP